MDIPYQQVAGIANASAENEYIDWGPDAMYERTYGPDVLVITANYLFETQNLGATFGATSRATPPTLLISSASPPPMPGTVRPSSAWRISTPGEVPMRSCIPPAH